MLTFTHLDGTPRKGAFWTATYENNRRTVVGLMAWDAEGEYWERYATLSVNVPLVQRINPGEFVAKEHMENEGLVQQFVDGGYFEDTGRRVDFGYVTGARVLRVTDKINEARLPE